MEYGGRRYLRDASNILDLERMYGIRRERLCDEVHKKRERREELSELTNRMGMAGQRTEDDLFYTMRNLGGDAAVELRQTLQRVQTDGDEAMRSMRYEISKVEEEEEACRREINRLDDEYALKRRALFNAEDEDPTSRS